MNNKSADKTARASSAVLSGVTSEIVDVVARLGGDSSGRLARRMFSTDIEQRLRRAVRKSGLGWPDVPIAVELAPAGKPVQASMLAVACATLVADGAVLGDRLADTAFVGALADSGDVLWMQGVLPAVVAACKAGLRRIIVPAARLPAGLTVPGLEVRGANTLADVIAWLGGDDRRLVTPAPCDAPPAPAQAAPDDLAGQPEARWAAEVAAAGGHELHVMGSPRVALATARHLSALVPRLTRQQALEVAAIHSVVPGSATRSPVDLAPPFVVHQGRNVPPKLVSSARHGLLLVDAIDLGRSRLDTLRGSATDVQLVLSGPVRPYHFDSGADLQVRLRPMPSEGLGAPEPIDLVRARVLQARERALQRWGASTATVADGVVTNPKFALSHTAALAFDRLIDKEALTTRTVLQLLRAVWTVADLAGVARPGRDELEKARALRGV
jgi:magnesium chelatase family protein